MEERQVPQEAAALLHKLYAAFNARNIAAAVALMHPYVEWPNGIEGGRVDGHAGVCEYWTRQWALIDPRVNPQRFALDPDGRIVIDVHQVIRDLAGAVIADQMVRHIYRVSSGLIEQMEIGESCP